LEHAYCSRRGSGGRAGHGSRGLQSIVGQSRGRSPRPRLGSSSGASITGRRERSEWWSLDCPTPCAQSSSTTTHSRDEGVLNHRTSPRKASWRFFCWGTAKSDGAHTAGWHLRAAGVAMGLRHPQDNTLRSQQAFGSMNVVSSALHEVERLLQQEAAQPAA
jgi:hypothetical protein